MYSKFLLKSFYVATIYTFTPICTPPNIYYLLPCFDFNYFFAMQTENMEKLTCSISVYSLVLPGILLAISSYSDLYKF